MAKYWSLFLNMLLTNKGLRCPSKLLKMSLLYSNSIWLPPDKNSRGLCYRSLPPSTCQSQVQCRSQEASTSCRIKVGFCAVISWVPFSSCGKEWLKGQRNCLTSNHRRKNSSSQTSLSSVFCSIPYPVCLWSGEELQWGRELFLFRRSGHNLIVITSLGK